MRVARTNHVCGDVIPGEHTESAVTPVRKALYRNKPSSLHEADMQHLHHLHALEYAEPNDEWVFEKNSEVFVPRLAGLARVMGQLDVDSLGDLLNSVLVD